MYQAAGRTIIHLRRERGDTGERGTPRRSGATGRAGVAPDWVQLVAARDRRRYAHMQFTRACTSVTVTRLVRRSRLRLAAGVLPLVFACSGSDDAPVAPVAPPASVASAVAIAPPTSERVTIDLSAGMPGQTH